MEKLIVKEFDKIHCNSHLDQYNNSHFIDRDKFVKLKKLIFTYDNENKGEISSFFKLGYNNQMGEYIQIQNYVGVIELPNLIQIEMLPKIIGHVTVEESRKILMRMIKYLDKFPMEISDNAGVGSYDMNILEIFINMYLIEAMKVLKKGLISDYVNHEESITYFKGKFNIGNHIKENYGRKDKVRMNFDEYDIDISENRVIKVCIEKLRKLSSDMQNQKLVLRLLPHFDGIKSSVNLEKEFNKIVIGRKNKYYKNIIQWTKIILKNKSFSSVVGINNARVLLFPMEKIFERYVGKLIKEKFNSCGYEVSLQEKSKYLFDAPKSFRLIPDIVIKKDRKIIAIMDTKWKILTSDIGNYGISQEDMYQMFTYSKLYNCEKIFLLYPKSDIGDKIIVYAREGIEVNVCFLDFLEVGKSIDKIFLKAEVL